MKPLHLVAGAALLCTASSFVTARVVLQDEAPPDAALPDEAAMMARMMELATPGEQHERLRSTCGNWTNDYKLRWSPDAPWMETSGTSERTELLGGRYVLETIEFSMMGMKIEGVNIYGYDKMKERWVNIWMDSSSTWPIFSSGTEGEEGAVSYEGTMIDVAGERPFRMVVTHEDADTRTIDMYDTIPPHGEVQVMSVRSVRD